MFWDLFAKSVITQSIITLMLVGCACWLWVTTGTVDDSLLNVLSIVVGFWMGSKIQHTVEEAMRGNF